MNNKMLIVVFIIILGIGGVIFFSIATNNNGNSNNNNNVNVTENSSNITSDNSSNFDDLDKSNNGKIGDYEKNNSFNQPNIKNTKPKLIAKNEAIKQTKSNLKNAGIEYLDVGSVELVKSDGKYYWAVSYTESDGRPSSMYINAERK
ncbi:MAG: hypothetical protein LBM96_00965 [Methanobrevibacter sp.]|nr:hypothetical protein [Candidatus Methanoflexus mossambicus]